MRKLIWITAHTLLISIVAILLFLLASWRLGRLPAGPLDPVLWVWAFLFLVWLYSGSVILWRLVGRLCKYYEGLEISFFFAWYDFWVGMFYDQKKKVLYVCPVPCCVVKIERRPKSWPVDHELSEMIARRGFLNN